MNSSNSKRIFYFDGIRAVAILCVVLLHVTGHLGEIMNYNLSTIHSFSGIYMLFANNFFRIGIALFLMLSGALLLGRDWDVKGFFSKRVPRILKPFIFWALVFSIILISSSYLISSINFVTKFGALDMINVFVNTLLCKAPGSEVYWFVWMMLAMYLLMPIINKWINDTDLSKIEYFLIIWVVYIVITHSLMIPVPEILSFFISPIGFVVLGYYLRYNERKIFNTSIIALVLIVVPSVLMFIYSYYIVDTTMLFVFNRYSILVMIEAIGVFCLFKSSPILNNPRNDVAKAVSSIAVCSYGMYLIHSQMIMVVRRLIHINFVFDYIIFFIVGFILSWIIIYVLAKIPIIDDYIGVK